VIAGPITVLIGAMASNGSTGQDTVGVMPDRASLHPIDTDDVIEVSLPLRPAFASMLRVVVASLGADADFTVDEIDDFKLGVSEVFTMLADLDDDPGRCSARFKVEEVGISVTMGRVGSAGGAKVGLDPLAATILSSVVDDVEIDDVGIRLVKRATESASNA
jgi:serine/threonine-protein kinase RsbW